MDTAKRYRIGECGRSSKVTAVINIYTRPCRLLTRFRRIHMYVNSGRRVSWPVVRMQTSGLALIGETVGETFHVRSRNAARNRAKWPGTRLHVSRWRANTYSWIRWLVPTFDKSIFEKFDADSHNIRYGIEDVPWRMGQCLRCSFNYSLRCFFFFERSNAWSIIHLSFSRPPAGIMNLPESFFSFSFFLLSLSSSLLFFSPPSLAEKRKFFWN